MTLAMVTIAAAMATIAEPMSVLDRPPPPTANFINGGVLLSMLAVNLVWLLSTGDRGYVEFGL